MEKEDIKLLKTIRGYINPSPMVNAVYHSPAQSMRITADLLDEKERVERQFDEFIKKEEAILEDNN